MPFNRIRVSLILPLLLMSSISYAQGSYRILVGSYTQNTPATGISLYSLDASTLQSSLEGSAPTDNPSFVILSQDGGTVYCVNEFNDGRQGVSSFSLQGNTLKETSHLSIPENITPGGDPCNLLLASGAIVTSNYTGGTLTSFRLKEDGTLDALSQAFNPVKEFQGLGLFKEGDAHMHCAVLSPDGKYIFAVNLGNDCVHRFELGPDGLPLGVSTVAWSHRGLSHPGPRHMVFSQDGKYAYLLCELGDKLVSFRYQGGNLIPMQTVTAYTGKGHGSADIHISPDGRFLYTSHRLKDEGISIFSIGAGGKVRRTGFQPTGKHPRNFAISPDGNLLLCACRDDDRIEIYRIDKKTGALSNTGKSIETGAPVCIQFIR